MGFLALFPPQHDPARRIPSRTSPDILKKGPSFRQDEQSLLLGVQYNLTGAEKAYSLKIGGFGGIGGTQAYFDPVPGIPARNGPFRTNGVTGKTSADNASGLGGVYALGTYSNFYLLGLASAYDGNTHITQLRNVQVDTATMGFVGGGLAGVQIPLARGDRAVFGQNITLDLRTGISYANSFSDAFNDNIGITINTHQFIGNSISDISLESWKASFSAKLATSFVTAGREFVPFIQAGYDNRFEYDNRLRVNSVEVKFKDDNKDYFSAIGITTQVAPGMEFNVGFRGDWNSSLYTLSGQVGLRFDLN